VGTRQSPGTAPHVGSGRGPRRRSPSVPGLGCAALRGHLLFPCGGKASGGPWAKALSPEAGVGFGPEAAGAEGRPVKLRWLFVSISAEGSRGSAVTCRRGTGLPVRQAPGPAARTGARGEGGDAPLPPQQPGDAPGPSPGRASPDPTGARQKRGGLGRGCGATVNAPGPRSPSPGPRAAETTLPLPRAGPGLEPAPA